jgi:hypothetical protein
MCFQSFQIGLVKYAWNQSLNSAPDDYMYCTYSNQGTFKCNHLLINICNSYMIENAIYVSVVEVL